MAPRSSLNSKSPIMAPDNRPKRDTIKAACEECRAKKTKCDGRRPVCTRCHKRGLECDYRTQPDESRMEAVRRRLRAMERQTNSCEALLRLLMHCPEQQAVEILTRLRSSDSVSSILTDINISGMQYESGGRPPLANTSSSGSVQSGGLVDRGMSASPMDSLTSAHSAGSSALGLSPVNSQTSIPPHSNVLDRTSIGFLINGNPNLEAGPSRSEIEARDMNAPANQQQSSPEASSYTQPDSEMPDYNSDTDKRSSESTRGTARATTAEPRDSDIEEMDAGHVSHSEHDAEEPSEWDLYYTDVSSLLQWLKTTAPKKKGN